MDRFVNACSERRLSRAERIILSMLLLLCLAVGAPAQAKGSTSYLLRLQERVQQWRAEIPDLKTSGTHAATGVLQGGSLYIAGPQQSFIWEAIGRAGGLVLSKVYAGDTALHENDTVLAASTGTQDAGAFVAALVQKAEAAKAHVVLFDNLGREGLPAADAAFMILPVRPFRGSATDSGPSIESVSNVVGMWAWTGEFVAACVAQGKMPCMYESIWMPGGRERLELFQKETFHSAMSVSLDSARSVSRRYLDAVAAALGKVETDDRAALEKAAALMEAGHAAGKSVRVLFESHMFPAEMQVPQCPDWLLTGNLADPPKPQETVLILGYQRFPWNFMRDPDPCIVSCVHRPPTEFTHDPNHVYLDAFWDLPDSCVDLQGYDVKILPLSGVMQCALFWQIVERTGFDRKQVQ